MEEDISEKIRKKKMKSFLRELPNKEVQATLSSTIEILQGTKVAIRTKMK